MTGEHVESPDPSHQVGPPHRGGALGGDGSTVLTCFGRGGYDKRAIGGAGGEAAEEAGEVEARRGDEGREAGEERNGLGARRPSSNEEGSGARSSVAPLLEGRLRRKTTLPSSFSQTRSVGTGGRAR